MELATAQKIISLEAIPGADLIETATVMGWQVVVKKGEFKVGELAVYIQIDTVVPETEQFEFLRERKFRVRTIKLRKQISQGLLIPLPDSPAAINEGTDLTDRIGVKKYSKDVEVFEDRPKMPKKWYKKWWYILKFRLLVKIFPWMKKVNRASFPKNLVSITDEERIQNMPRVLESHKGKDFVVSEKLDGSSITIIKWKSRYRICSRRFELFNTNNEWSQVFEATNFADHIEALAKWFRTNSIIVQGEFIGKPQGNKYQVENQIRLFNIFVDGKRVRQDTFYVVCGSLNIPTCPLIDTVSLEFDLSKILSFAEGKSLLNPKVEREGVVFRSLSDQTSFKVISNRWLLANQE